MKKISILSASVRTGRKSPRVVKYFKRFIEEKGLAEVDVIDLAVYNFPIFDERLRYQNSPTEAMLDFSRRISSADGIIIVTPEYNGGYPSSLKNAVDLLYDEWHRKPVAISTVSDGAFGGSQVITSLQFSLWKIRAWTVPAMFPVPSVDKSFDENGIAADPEKTDKRASHFVNELLWCMEAKRRMSDNEE